MVFVAAFRLFRLPALGVAASCALGPAIANGQDFTLSAAPIARQICSPAEATYDVTVGSLLGYSDPVALSTEGQPASTTVVFGANPVFPPGVSVMTIANTGTAAPGGYSITVEGTAPTHSHSTSVRLHLANAIPGLPVLTFPPAGSTGVLLRPSLIWDSASQANAYTVQVNDSPVFDSPLLAERAASPGLTLSGGLLPNTTYFWRVRSENGCGVQAYSEPFVFTTGTSAGDPIPREPDFRIEVFPSTQEICTPNDAEQLVGIAPFADFDEPVTLSSSGQPAGTTVVFGVNPVATPGTSLLTIANTGSASAGEYPIIVYGDSISLSREGAFVLIVSTSLPGLASPLSPADGATGIPHLPTLSWSPGGQARRYTLEISESPQFDSLAFSGTSFETELTLATPLNENTEYHWRVQGENACGTQNYSQVFSFTTTDQPFDPDLIFRDGFEPSQAAAGARPQGQRAPVHRESTGG